MKVTATIVFVYGLAIALGGIMGFVRGGSQISLISGGSFGLALLLCSWYIGKEKIAAQYVALGLTFVLDGLFTWRFAKTLQFFPTGLLSLISLAAMIVLALSIRKTAKSQ